MVATVVKLVVRIRHSRSSGFHHTRKFLREHNATSGAPGLNGRDLVRSRFQPTVTDPKRLWTSNSSICCSGVTTNPYNSSRVSGHIVADRWNPVGGDWLPQDLIRNRSSGLALMATDDERRTGASNYRPQNKYYRLHKTCPAVKSAAVV